MFLQFILFLLCSVCFSSNAAVADTVSQLTQNERDVMLALAKDLPGRLGWNTTTQRNPCLWPSVNCSGSHVIGLSLSASSTATNSSTTADIFTQLCRLDSLQTLDLSNNLFNSIPASFFTNCTALSGLKSLNLSINLLTGPLYNLSAFPALESLDLSYNHFTGAVNSQLDGLLLLKTLNLSSNQLTGAIPALKSIHLEKLVLSGNKFSHQIPDHLFQYKNLTVLDLSENSLSGSVPDAFGNLSSLQTLLLSSNNLTGRIPGSLSNIASLSRFAANQNLFNGSIPAGITRYTRTLDLSYNNLTGEIPSDLLSPPALEFVDLTANQLQGHIPMDLSKNSSYRLYRLRLGQNSLTGSIPPAVGNLSSLTYLELDDNQLDAGIPPQLEGCKNLTLLNLAYNRLQGGLPKELGNLQQLVVMKLQMNNLSGNLPDQLFKLTNLSTLNLSWNSLNGEIPSAISHLQRLSTLNLQGNKLSGSIPDTINQFSSLIELQLGSNELNGTVPRMPTTLATALNLSSNHLSGSIPSYLSSLIGLEVLDLSDNNFTGEVPVSFTQMPSLIQLVLSNNQLSGVLPQFHNWVAVNITGNKDLLNASDVVTPPASSRKKKHHALLIIVAIVSAIVGSVSVTAIVLLLVSKRFYRVEDITLQPEENPSQIVVNGCLLTSNSIHRSSIDFTKALEAVSNPANVMLKTRFSTYYKAEMPSGVTYSIKKLNWSDKLFQTGSHGRFKQELEALGRLSSSNVMVPLAYVLTGDSAYLFYEHIHKGTVFDFLHRGSENALDWPSRYSIALGVAQGLAFLHGCAQPVLLLDLTTKSIHLKSLKEPQLGDIELCKVIDPSKSTGSLSTVAGSVGYIPPEYAYTMRVTASGNVYSFGVVLLELLTGKPPVNAGIELAKRATMSCSARLDEREKILDQRICKTSPAVRSQMLSVLKVALECVSFSPDARPKMRNVLRVLFNAR